MLKAQGHAGENSDSLVHGNELLEAQVSRGTPSQYSVESVRDVLADVDAPEGLASLGFPDDGTAWGAFVGYLVLDAIIGNTDRHQENWGVIVRSGRRKLAPTFDHASCLGFLLRDAERQNRLETNDRGFTPEAFADRAKSPFDGKPHPIEVARRAVEMSHTGAAEAWIHQCRNADGLVEPVWKIPEHRMSAAAREFAKRVIVRNCRRLLELIQ